MKNQRQLLATAVFLSFGTPWAQSQTTFTDVTVSNALKVQTSPTTGNRLELRGNGILIAKGNSPATLLPADIYQYGFLWHPGKNALITGGIHPEEYYGYGSTSLGWGMASGDNSVALGGSAYGYSSTSSGYSSAVGDLSIAGGNYGYAEGFASFAFTGKAYGDVSVALNNGIALGDETMALGHYTSAGAFASLAIGQYNVGNFTPSPNADPYQGGDKKWIATDPVFEIGNGSSSNARSNAFTVYKNGNADLRGKLSFFSGPFTTTPTIVLDPASSDIKINNQSVLKTNASGYLGIGTTSPAAPLTIGNNVATGFLDNFNEYQALLYTTGGATSSYGLGIKNDTMVFNSGAGAYSFDSGGNTSRMVIGTSGNVGIGTNNPQARLSVSGGAISQSDFSDGEKIFFLGTPQAAKISHEVAWTVAGYAGALNSGSTNIGQFAWKIVDSAGTGWSEKMRLSSSGLEIKNTGLKVGETAVNTATDGSVSIGRSLVNYTPTQQNWSNTGSTLLLTALDYSTIAFHDSGERVDFIRGGKGTIQMGYNAGWGEAKIGMPGNGIWDSAGNVGIGTAAPSEKLQVAGNIKTSGTIQATGIIRCAAGGDISMGSFTAGTAP